MEEQKEKTNIKKKKKKTFIKKKYPYGVDHDKTHHYLGYYSHYHFLINDNLQN